MKAKKGKPHTAESDAEETEIAPKKNAKKPKPKSKSKVATDEDDDRSDVEDKSAKKKHGIRFKVTARDSGDDDADETEVKGGGKERKKPAKRKRDDNPDSGDESAQEDVISSPIPKKRKKTTGQASKKKKGTTKADGAADSSDDNRPLREVASRKSRGPAPDEGINDAKSLYLDLKFWKKCRESLNGTYKAARKNLTQHDGWQLPPGIPDDKFADVANYTLSKMDK